MALRDQLLTFSRFLSSNLRWLAGGILLTFCSSVGQTFFIASFAGEIRADFDLSHGDFGIIYMLATLGSAATLILVGRVADEIAIYKVAMALIVLLAAAALLMASAETIPILLISIYFLRLLGQGMMTHTAMVAMGRWFVVERGRAVSVTSTGHQLGEGVLPLVVIALLAMTGWRTAWVVAAIVLVFVALPLSYLCLRTPRTPSQGDRDNHERGRQWTRAEVLRDAPFWAVCTGVLAPAFIGTSVFFHQVHLSALKDWAPGVVASSFAVMSITSVCVGLLTGHVIDRYSARFILPFFLLPLALGCLVLSLGQQPFMMSVFMFLLGGSYGVSNAVFGAIWPEIYGTRHLGAVRSVVSAAMVFASALGPGLTGWLIDLGVGFEQQLLVMCLYCVATMLVLFPVSKVLRQRHLLQPSQ
ncbi:MFS transporter [Granulosicoccus antarcticus]|uniref:Putative sulfoacetate transporter SauU n=1 Tax=Granulosicoccus antarcticus IMCC3135 TaxID=1192854 RepID=A0A2Z2NYU8_9GAMM|nr:MFS transporter [Granulosicoccus antarcticus]ASJ74938.1 putative sulfoacetate transporter SauU [Granulosicoccus antarcticus IMCC3135]